MKLELIGNYWTDTERTNRWKCDDFTLEQAEKEADTQKECLNMTDCSGLMDCLGLRDCSWLRDS